MGTPATRLRSRRSYEVQIAVEAALWLLNLYRIITRLHTMGFMMAASAGMLFLFAPLDIYRAWNHLHEAKA